MPTLIKINQQKPYFSRHARAGFSLPEVMIGVALLGVFGFIMMRGLDGTKIMGLKSQRNNDRIDFAMNLRDRIDCIKTLDPSVLTPRTLCSTATPQNPASVALRDASNTILVDASLGSTELSSQYQARGICYREGEYTKINAYIAPSGSTSETKVFTNLPHHCWDEFVSPTNPGNGGYYPDSNYCCLYNSSATCYQCLPLTGGAGFWTTTGVIGTCPQTFGYYVCANGGVEKVSASPCIMPWVLVGPKTLAVACATSF